MQANARIASKNCTATAGIIRHGLPTDWKTHGLATWHQRCRVEQRCGANSDAFLPYSPTTLNLRPNLHCVSSHITKVRIMQPGAESRVNLLTVRDVAGRLAISASSVYALVEAGRIVCHRIGIGRGAIRIDERDLDEFLDACRTSPRPTSRVKLPQPTLKHLKI